MKVKPKPETDYTAYVSVSRRVGHRVLYLSVFGNRWMWDHQPYNKRTKTAFILFLDSYRRVGVDLRAVTPTEMTKKIKDKDATMVKIFF